jgi:uncharacterized membrane protein YdjX (TVP38/TMEM64 family)
MSESPIARGGGLKWLRPVLVLLTIVALLGVAHALDLQEQLKRTLSWINGLGPWGPLAYAALYTLSTVAFIPGSFLTVGAGALFGVLQGSIIASISATLGATAAFLVGRYFARDWLGRRMGASRRFKALDDAVAQEGWKIVLLTRLSPIFPFTLLNYAFGLTRVPLREYVLATWIGMMPGTVMYVYLGSLAGSLVTLDQSKRTRSTTEWVLYGVGLLATLLVTLYVTRLARRALTKQLGA